MSKFLAYLFLLLVSLANWVCLLIYGFGITPRNWWVVIGCGIVVQVLVRQMAVALEKEKE